MSQLHLARDTALSALSSVLGTGARLFVTATLARKLAPEAFGQFAFIQFAIDLIGLLCSFGVSGVLTRYLPQLEAANPLIGKLRLVAIFSVFLSAVALLIYCRLDSHFAQFDLRILTLWAVTGLTLNFVYASLQGIFRYDALLVGNIAFAVAAPFFVSVLARPGSADSAAGALAASLTISGCAAIVAWKIRAVGHSTNVVSTVPSTREVLSYGAHVWITGLIVSLVWSRGEFAILRAFASDATIGLYGVALTLTSLVTQGAGLFTGALTPHLVRHWTAREEVQLTNTLTRITALLLMATCGAAAILIAFGPLLIQAGFGSAYLGSQQLVYVLSVGALAIASGPASLLLQIQSNARFGLVTNVVALGLLLLGSAALTPTIGTSGAATARALSQLVVGTITFWHLRKLTGLAVTARRLLNAWLVCTGGVACFAGFVACVSLGHLLRGVATTVMLLALMWIIQRMLGIKPVTIFRDYMARRAAA